jgi:hypothetical protein
MEALIDLAELQSRQQLCQKIRMPDDKKKERYDHRIQADRQARNPFSWRGILSFLYVANVGYTERAKVAFELGSHA